MHKGRFECPECRNVYYVDRGAFDSLLTCGKCGTKVGLTVTASKVSECENGLRITLTAVALLGALGSAKLINGWNVFATIIIIGGLIY